jgi:nucleoside-diphosphate-sugar epimerase
MTVLIVGCGDLGTEAGLRFVQAGERVVGWRRSPEKLPSVLEGAEADLRRELPRLPVDTDVVVLASAADGPSEEAYRAAYLDGARNLLSALKRDRVVPRLLIFVSSTAVYGDAGGEMVDEATPTTATGFSGRILRETEELLQEQSFPTVSLRLGGIYGPGRTRLIDQIRSGTAAIPPDVRYTNRIHRNDAAAAIVHLAGLEAPEQIYVGVDLESAPLGDVLRFLAAELGEPDPPTGLVDPPRGGNKRCSSKKLQRTGFTFAFPSYREGYREVLHGHGIRHP